MFSGNAISTVTVATAVPPSAVLVETVAVAPPAIMMVIVGLPEFDADVLLAPVALNRMVWVVPAATETILKA